MRSFAAFSDHDFEYFIADLYGEIDSVHYEVFARGPDKGVDLRHFPEPGEAPDVLQCKRYVRSTWSDLKRAAQDEVRKLEGLGTELHSYRFGTTLELTAANKDELAGIFDSYVSGPEGVIAGGDLETLLDANERVERRHPKLWLSGGTQLDAILHGATYERSRQLLEETRAALPRYVETRPFFQSRTRLREEKVLVIAGAPGIGKSTLARMLLADAALDEYEPVEISADAEEANEVFRSDQRQAFYYDDFLGTTFLQDRLVKNEDKRIAQLIRRVVASETSLFLMTTREHILAQALQFYEDLEREGIDARRYLLELGGYTRLDRARIFYNHIWSSGQLDQHAREELRVGDGYARIVDHANYNPRLIEHITGLGSHHLSDTERSGYIDFAVGVLDDPSRIWRHAFESQLDYAQRGLLLTLVSMQSKVVLNDLRAAFYAYCAAAGISASGNFFEVTMRVLDDSFLATHRDEGKTFAEPINPSIVDFIAAWLRESPQESRSACAGASYFTQIEWLVRSVLPGVPESDRATLIAELASAVERLYDSDEPRWESVRFGGIDGEIHTSRRWVQHVERLIFLTAAMRTDEELGAALEDFYADRLRAEIESWAEGHLLNAANPVSLVAALQRARRPTEEVADAAKAYLIRSLHDAYDWEQISRLRQISGDSFDEEELRALRESFFIFAGDKLESRYDEIEDTDEIDRIETLASGLKVEIDEGHLRHARERVEEQTAVREARADRAGDEERLSSTYTEADDESEAVSAVFAHLAFAQED